MASKIFFSLTFGFILGVLFATNTPPSLGVVCFILVVFGVFLAGFFLYRRRVLYGVCICIVFGVLFGVARGFFVETTVPQVFVPLIGTEVTLQGKIVEDPDIREETQRITVLIEKEGRHTKVLAVAPLFPKREYGEMIELTGTVERPEPFASNGGRVFRYDSFLAKDGIFLIVPRAFLSLVHEPSGIVDSLVGGSISLKHSFVDALSLALPEPESALAEGILVGGKQGLGQTLLQLFIVTGLIHVVVLSGYNVMIVAEAVRKLFSLFPKVIANSLAGIVVLFFVLLSGAGSASIRAGLMASIGLFARATNRTYDALRALIVAGLFMLVLNPLLLLNDPGFQLSFVATLGLILGAPLFEKIFGKIQNAFLRDILASTVAAQVAVLPLLLYQTGILSLVALPANVLVLPLVPLGMATAAFAAVVSLLVPSIAPLVGLPSFLILWTMISFTEFFASLPFASITLPAFPFFLVCVSYSALFFLWKKFSTQKVLFPQRHSS